MADPQTDVESVLTELASVEYADLSEVERHALIERMVACFVGLPGVVGAPMISGTEFWSDVARHLIELGWRDVAKPIKKYVPATSLEPSEAAGTYEYADPGLAPEDPRVRYANIHEIEEAEAHERIRQMREAGELPPENATPAEQQAWRDKRARQREKAVFKGEVRRRKVDGTLVDSPHATVAKPRKKGRR